MDGRTSEQGSLVTRIIYRERHGLHPGDVILAILATGFLAAGFLFLTVPDPWLRSPVYSVIFDLAPRQSWGLIFLAVSIAPLWAVIKPTEINRMVGLGVATVMGVCWASGLLLPIVRDGTGNVIAFIPWTMVALIGYALFALVPFDSPFWRPVARKG